MDQSFQTAERYTLMACRQAFFTLLLCVYLSTVPTNTECFSQAYGTFYIATLFDMAKISDVPLRHYVQSFVHHRGAQNVCHSYSHLHGRHQIKFIIKDYIQPSVH